jgi:flagellar hook-associated protein 2
VTAGNFTVNGTKISIATTDSINDVLNSINANVPGVSASYDAATDKITLSSGGAIVLGAANDTSNFLQSMRLTSNASGTAVSASALGCIKLTGPIDAAKLANPVASATNSSFKINDTEITYNTSTDSLQTLISRINASAAGVTATLDSSTGQMVLTSNQTGNIGIFVSDDAGGLASSLGMVGATLSNGTDAEFKLNGGSTLTSRSNTLDTTAHGITGLSVTASNVGTESVTVAADTASTKASVQKFIDDYNAVQNAIEKYTKVTTTDNKVTAAILSGNRELSDISRSLRKMLYESTSGITGTVQRLSDIGVGFSGIANTISITNASLLDSKLASSADDISTYLNTDTNGLIARMDSMLSSLVSDSGTSSGSLKAQLDTITSQNKSLDTQIADIDRRLEMQRSSMELSFQAMETAQSRYQQQSSYISKTFSGSN